jgi:hypothetical protein
MNGNQMYSLFCVGFAAAVMFGESIPETAVDRAVRPFADFFYANVGELLPFIYVVCLAYVACVFFVSPRKPYDLRGWLACWSFSLAAFSAYGAVRTVPALARLLEVYGVYQSVCGGAEELYMYGNTGSWVSLFIFSKLPELFDTAFIVLRKKPLILLHWYHHVTVLLYTWHSLAERASTGLWFVAMNYTVHAFMYLFYGFVALGVRPSWFAEYITILQIVQMVAGMAVSLYTLVNKPECKTSWENAVGSVIMYMSYLLLFVRFYLETYSSSGVEERQKTKKKTV